MPDNAVKLTDEIDREKLLVEVVQGLLMAHARLDSLEKSLADKIFTGFSDQDRSAKIRHTGLEANLTFLGSKSTAIDTFVRAESTKQSQNWNNIQLYLKNWQDSQDKTLANVTKEIQGSASHVASKLESSKSELRDLTTRQVTANRRLLIWLIWLSGIAICCLGAILYTLFLHL